MEDANVEKWSKHVLEDAAYIEVIRGDHASVKKYLDLGWDPNTFYTHDRKEYCIMRACLYDDLEMVKLLVDHGALIDPPLQHALRSPLIIACINNCENIIKFLVSHGARLNDTGRVQDLYSLILGKESTELLEYFLQHGLDPDKKIEDKLYTPLYVACRRQKLEHAKCLIRHGANVHKTSRFGTTPLMAVCNLLDKEIIELLVESGSDLNACAENHKSVLDNLWEQSLIMDFCLKTSHTHTRIYSLLGYLIAHGASKTRYKKLELIVRKAKKCVHLVDRIHTTDVLRFIHEFYG